jgi:hypothetical protein
LSTAIIRYFKAIMRRRQRLRSENSNDFPDIFPATLPIRDSLTLWVAATVVRKRREVAMS